MSIKRRVARSAWKGIRKSGGTVSKYTQKGIRGARRKVSDYKRKRRSRSKIQ